MLHKWLQRCVGGWLLCAVFAVACLPAAEMSSGVAGFPVPPEEPSETIFVASNGWHSAIFIQRKTLLPDTIPELVDFPDATYLGFGWGDAEYFPARDPGFLTLLSAALVPTPSVLHVTGLRTHPREVYSGDQVIALRISLPGHKRLVGYFRQSFDRGDSRRSKPVAPGLDRNSRFYRAVGEFHLFNTCNSWTARGLAAAGVPIEPGGIVTAGELMEQLGVLAKP